LRLEIEISFLIFQFCDFSFSDSEAGNRKNNLLIFDFLILRIEFFYAG